MREKLAIIEKKIEVLYKILNVKLPRIKTTIEGKPVIFRPEHDDYWKYVNLNDEVIDLIPINMVYQKKGEA